MPAGSRGCETEGLHGGGSGRKTLSLGTLSIAWEGLVIHVGHDGNYCEQKEKKKKKETKRNLKKKGARVVVWRGK